jgi:transposase
LDTYKQKVIQHLGIVAEICNEIELIKEIDKEIEKPKRKVTVGQAVQSIILNALGFSGRAMYLHTEYYQRRPVELLVGEGIEPEDLNEDCLGSALDALYDHGVTELFYKVASKALATYDIEHRFVHLDTTSFSLHGKYDKNDDSDMEVVSITRGFSKDGRQDLNQVVASMMCAYRSSIPVLVEVRRVDLLRNRKGYRSLGWPQAIHRCPVNRRPGDVRRRSGHCGFEYARFGRREHLGDRPWVCAL